MSAAVMLFRAADRIDVGAAVDQALDRFYLSARRGEHEARVAEFVADVDVEAAAREQLLEEIDSTPACGLPSAAGFGPTDSRAATMVPTMSCCGFRGSEGTRTRLRGDAAHTRVSFELESVSILGQSELNISGKLGIAVATHPFDIAACRSLNAVRAARELFDEEAEIPGRHAGIWCFPAAGIRALPELCRR